MRKSILLLSLLTFISACTTPSTMLKNKRTGQIVECGGTADGSLTGGMIGYSIQKSNDEKCVSRYLKQGFTKVK
ncbi:MAG: hypothetical protein V3V19_10555 [Cocleimonas sp.]